MPEQNLDPARHAAVLERDHMNPLKIRRFWQTRWQLAVGILVCFCLLGLAPAGYGQNDNVSRLIRKLRDPDDYEVRWSAAKALGKIKDPRAVEPLIAALGDPYYDVRMSAAEALGKIGMPAVTPLIAALTNTNSSVRDTAADALGEIKDPRAVEPLIAALTDANYFVRTGAAYALGEIKDTRAIKPLIAALGKEKVEHSTAPMRTSRRSPAWPAPTLSNWAYYVQESMTKALVKIGAPAIDPLIAALKDTNIGVRWAAVDALGEIKDSRAVEPLIATLKDTDFNVRDSAAKDLGELKDSRAVVPLIDAMKEDTETRAAALESHWQAFPQSVDKTADLNILIDALCRVQRDAVEALGKINDPRALEPLIDALKDTDSDVRGSAAEALGRIKDPRAIEPLVAALGKETDMFIRSGTARALAGIGAPVVEPLIAALKNPDPDTRRRAAEDLVEVLRWQSSQKAPSAVSALLAAWSEHDTVVIAGADQFFITRGEPGSEDVLIEALYQSGGVKMADDFLSCGNVKLEDAAHKWAASHGYRIESTSFGRSIGWGSAR